MRPILNSGVFELERLILAVRSVIGRKVVLQRLVVNGCHCCRPGEGQKMKQMGIVKQYLLAKISRLRGEDEGL